MAFKPPPTPDGVNDLLEHERKYTALADALDAQAMALLSGGPDIAPMVASRGKELALAAVRARRCAAELAKYRYDLGYEAWLIGEHQRMGGR